MILLIVFRMQRRSAEESGSSATKLKANQETVMLCNPGAKVNGKALVELLLGLGMSLKKQAFNQNSLSKGRRQTKDHGP
jgi:hypothetical protein